MNQDMLYDYERHGLFQNFPPEIWLILRATRLFFESCFESWNENCEHSNTIEKLQNICNFNPT